MKPNDPIVYATIAGFYNSQGDFPKTMEALQKAAELDPQNPPASRPSPPTTGRRPSKTTASPPRSEGIHRTRASKPTDKALSLNAEYADALLYKNILLRMRGNDEPDLAKRNILYKEADELRNRAIELNKKRASGVK